MRFCLKTEDFKQRICSKKSKRIDNIRSINQVIWELYNYRIELLSYPQPETRQTNLLHSLKYIQYIAKTNPMITNKL